jgi:hypothetical protein
VECAGAAGTLSARVDAQVEISSLVGTGFAGSSSFSGTTVVDGLEAAAAVGTIDASSAPAIELGSSAGAGAAGDLAVRVDVEAQLVGIGGSGGAGDLAAQGEAPALDAQVTLGTLAAVGDATAPAAQSDAVQVILAGVEAVGEASAPTVAEAPVDVQAPAPPPIADGVLALIAQHVAQLQAAEDEPQPQDATVVLGGVEAWAQVAPIGAKAHNPAIRLVARLDAVATLGKGVAAVCSMPMPGRAAGAPQLVRDDELEDAALLLASGWR